MVNKKIFDVIQFYYEYTIFYLDFNNQINYYQFDNINKYYSKNFKIESFCSFLDNNERTLKHFEEYLKLIIT